MAVVTPARPLHGSALALVESPAQLLNAVEWAAASEQEIDAVIVAPRGAHGRLQLHEVIDYASAAHHLVRSVEWCEARVGSGAVLRAVRHLAPRVQRADVLVLGDPFSRLLQTIAPFFGGSRLVVVDDGTATIEFADRLAEHGPIVRWHKGRVGEADRLLARVASRALRHAEIFTAMPLAPQVARRLDVSRNEYRWLRGLFPLQERREGSTLVGTSLVETGVVDPDAYLGAVATLAGTRELRCYYAHRRESAAKLAAIAAFGIRVLRPTLPLEMELARGPVPSRVLSFPSTVLHTLPIVLAGREVAIEALPVGLETLRDEVSGRAQHFLARAAAPLAS